MNHASIALVDVSYAFRHQWHGQTGREVNEAGVDTLRDIGWIRQSVSHVICCLDAPPYNRATVYPDYKAQRDPPSETMKKQRRWLLEKLKKEGYQLARAQGYEADDIIATLAVQLRPYCEDIRIVGRDKDLYQVANGVVRIFEPAVGERPETLVGANEVWQKMGVAPVQVPEVLALTGDKADNVPGCPGCGPKSAAKLISEYGTLDALFKQLDADPSKVSQIPGIGPSLVKKLSEHRVDVMQARELVRLATDAPLDVDALLQPKKPEPAVIDEDGCDGIEDAMTGTPAPRDTDVDELIVDRRAPKSGPRASEAPPAPPAPKPEAKPEPEAADGVIEVQQRSTDIVRAADVPEYNRRLEPQTMQQAVWLAQQMEKSGMFPKLRRHQEHLMVIMAGRSLGLDAVQSLMNFHVLDGVPAPKWTLVQGMVQRHHDCEWFMMTESTDESATYECKRRQNPKPQRLTYTLKQAEKAGRVRPGGGWVKDSAAMCRKTAAVHLGRAVFPDLPIFGFYTDEELAA